MTIYDDSIKHRVNIEKLKNDIAKKTIKSFLLIYPELKDFLLNIESRKVNSIINEINKIIDAENKILKRELIDSNIAIAQYESKFQSLLISKVSNDKLKAIPLNKETAKTLVLNNFVQGELFDKTFNRLGDSFKTEIERSIRMSVLNGETGAQAASRVKGSFNIKSNQLNSLTRTLIQNVTALSDEEVYKQNSNIIQKVKYVAIMDSRTTDICMSLNGKIFEIGEGPRPPQHFNCRSFTIPIIDINEDIPDDKNYNDWYKRQDNKNGLKSKEKERFVTDETKTLKQLEREEL